MNRLIMSHLSLFGLLAALCSAGCVVERTSSQDPDSEQSAGSEIVGIDSNGEERATAKNPQNKKLNTNGSEGCASCGPLPDPWTEWGPLPDPWQSRPASTIDPNAPTSSSSSSGGSGHKDK
jgi:hypothetical protein